MHLPTVAPLTSRERGELAPAWHTTLLVALIVAVAITGTLLARSGGHAAPRPAPSRLLGAYLPLLVMQWGLLLYVCRVGRRHSALGALLGRGWDGIGRAAQDLALACVAWVAIEALALACARWLFLGRNAAVSQLLPSTVAERLTWVAVAASVGFCEEVVYRGYLLRQLTALSRARTSGVLLQALLFGVAHAEQGPSAALRVAFFGLILGVLAQVRGSLWPGIICHVGIDLVTGLLGR